MMHIYDSAESQLNITERFLLDGLLAGESVVSIATHKHQKALDIRLLGRGVDVAALRNEGRYITPNAEETLARFMAGGWPDEERFRDVIGEFISRARAHSTRVRAFGELGSVLWARGKAGATIQLEHYWHSLCREHAIPRLCTYSRDQFQSDTWPYLRTICLTHTRVISDE